MFLYGRFPNYGPVRRIPKPLAGDNSPPEYRVQGWSLGHPRQSLIRSIDDKGSFIFHLYTYSFFPGVEGVDRIYLEPAFSTRNNKGSGIEGVFDFWLLCVRPHVLPGFIVIDTVGIIEGALFPFSYRPDRVCRQFGLDQPPLSLELDPLPVHEAKKVVLFVEWQRLPSFDSYLFIPPDHVGRVLDEWVTYQRRLKALVVFYDGVKSASPPHKILIIRFIQVKEVSVFSEGKG
ncbi:CHD3-type chromatin-remodeling factor PICKLE [Sesbania bispinosa]|nr:CHD3-type chromatin-remodeling factor PICKLE [Sesbania bispinosa]